MDTDDSKPWNVSWEESHEAPYMHKGIKWVSFDNQESIRIKTNYAYQHNLAGVMTWSIDTDDFKGKQCNALKRPKLILNSYFR